MRVHVEGEGPDLVLLHGWAMRPEVWSDVAAALAREFRVHNVDLNSINAAYSLDALTQRLAAMEVANATVCGWSLGGQIALNWALTEPRRIARLVLMATTPRFVNGVGWEYGMNAQVFDRFVNDLNADANETLSRFVSLQAHGDVSARDVARQLRASTASSFLRNRQSLLAGLEMLKDTDLRPHLDRIELSALVVHGERDTVVPLAAGAYLARELADAQLQVVAGAAHAPFVSDPAAVVAAIRAFCHG